MDPSNYDNGEEIEKSQAKRRQQMKRSAGNEACVHDVVLKDLCAHCGKRLHLEELQGQSDAVGEAQSRTPRVSMLHHVPELKVSSEVCALCVPRRLFSPLNVTSVQKAQEIGETDRTNLLKARKLVLLVDLDQTLIHTTNRPPRPDENTADIIGYRLGGGHYYTKLRPHVKEFLAQMHVIYEMHVVSFGERLYAHKIAEMLDPENKLFNHRVLSRNELFSAVHKTPNLEALFPCGEEMLTIIDDRADVWQCSDSQYNPRLIRVRPYRYFTGVDDVNAVGTLAAQPANIAPVSEESRAEEQDAVLKHLADVLTRVHARFYELYDAEQRIHDTKEVILSMAGEVLRGEHVVLSGLVPLGQRPNENSLYRMCVQYGAEVEEQVGELTTVVVAARQGTEGRESFRKTKVARKRQIPVVSARWLEQCWERWQRVDPCDYLLTDPVEQANISSGVKSAPLMGGSSTAPLPRASVDFDSLCADTTIIGEGTLRQMDDEVDEALSSSSSNSPNQKNGASSSSDGDDGGEEEEDEDEDSGEYDDVVAGIESQLVGKLSESDKT